MRPHRNSAGARAALRRAAFPDLSPREISEVGVSQALLAGLREQMRTQARHLRAIPSDAPPACRTIACALERQGTLGFCRSCEAVYLAAVELRERLLARRGAQLRAARPALFDGMAPDVRERLLGHVAAQGAHRGIHPSALEIAGLEDFLAELRELGLERLS
jgi:hypothetical protein